MLYRVISSKTTPQDYIFLIIVPRYSRSKRKCTKQIAVLLVTRARTLVVSKKYGFRRGFGISSHMDPFGRLVQSVCYNHIDQTLLKRGLETGN
jgi:hypothetical protein